MRLEKLRISSKKAFLEVRERFLLSLISEEGRSNIFICYKKKLETKSIDEKNIKRKQRKRRSCGVYLSHRHNSMSYHNRCLRKFERKSFLLVQMNDETKEKRQ